MISLCDKCDNNDVCLTNTYIKPALRSIGMEFTGIYCSATDQPEEERWEDCVNYKSIGGGLDG